MEKFESGKFIKFLKSAWVKYEFKIVLAIVLVLIAGISFEAGYVKGKGQKTSPISIEKAPECPKIGLEEQNNAIIVSDNISTQKKPAEANLASTQDMQKCPYVGSKNSDKYYPPTCSYAKRIKPENLACFQTEAEALAENRARSTGCKY